MILFGKEDIEKMGFKYEPDESKCKIAKTKAFYGSIDVWDNEKGGKKAERSTIMTSDDYNPRDYKSLVAQTCPFLYVHSFEIPDDVPTQDGHWDIWVCARGHTLKSEEDPMMMYLKDAEAVKQMRDLMQDLMAVKQKQYGSEYAYHPDDVKGMMEEVFLWGYEKGKGLK